MTFSSYVHVIDSRQGYTEVRYDEERKRVVYEPLQLTQAFRYEYFTPAAPVGTDTYVFQGISSHCLPGSKLAMVLSRADRRSLRLRLHPRQRSPRSNLLMYIGFDLIRNTMKDSMHLTSAAPVQLSYSNLAQLLLIRGISFVLGRLIQPTHSRRQVLLT